MMKYRHLPYFKPIYYNRLLVYIIIVYVCIVNLSGVVYQLRYCVHFPSSYDD